MIGARIRLNDHERAYILRLIAEDTKHQQGLLGKPITKLVRKLEEPEEVLTPDTTNKKEDI